MRLRDHQVPSPGVALAHFMADFRHTAGPINDTAADGARCRDVIIREPCGSCAASLQGGIVKVRTRSATANRTAACLSMNYPRKAERTSGLHS